MKPSPVELTVVAPERLLTVNAERRIHWSQRARIVRAWRWATKIEALAAHVPHYDRVKVVVTIYQARRPLADPGAHEPVSKAMIDGLRDARILDDDTGEQVASITYRPPLLADDKIARVVLELRPA